MNFLKIEAHLTGKISPRDSTQVADLSVLLGGQMEFLSFVNNVNWEAIVQLTLVAAIMISGPVVIFLLAVRGGNL